MIHLSFFTLQFLESSELISISASYSQFSMYNKTNRQVLSIQKDRASTELILVEIKELLKLNFEGILTPTKISVQQWCDSG